MIIPTIELLIEDGVADGRGAIYACQTSASKVIVKDAARRGARVIWNPADVSRTDRDRKTPRDGNTSIMFLI